MQLCIWMFAELLLEMVWEEGSWEVFVDNKSPRIIVKVEFMDQSLKMNENPSIFLLWKKNQDQDGPDYKVVLWVGRWHIWQNHCVILLLTCLLHSLFLSDTVYCECSNKLLLRELVKKGKKRFISHIFDFGMKIQSEFPVYFCLSTIWCLISDDPMVAEMVPFYLADNTFIHFIYLL